MVDLSNLQGQISDIVFIIYDHTIEINIYITDIT